FAKLRHGRLSTETVYNISHQGQWLFPRERLDRRQIVRFACEKMFLRERRQIFCRVLDLHGMVLLACKIDLNLIEEKVPFGHATEPPTLVQTKRARLQLSELLRGFCRKFSRFNKFL